MADQLEQQMDQLEQQMEQLERASKQQEAFLHSFAHETKTPLTSIIGYAELLLSHTDSPDIVREGAGYIFREGRRMERLSQKLMEWIVLEKSAFSMQEVEMGQYLAAIACTVEPAMKKKEITLLVEAEPSQIWLEPDLIETVCMNLLDNAAKSIEGKGKILLKGSMLPEGYQIEVQTAERAFRRRNSAESQRRFIWWTSPEPERRGALVWGCQFVERSLNCMAERFRLRVRLEKARRYMLC